MKCCHWGQSRDPPETTERCFSVISFKINLFCSLPDHQQLSKQQSQVAIELEHSMWNEGAWWHLPAEPSLTFVDCSIYFTNFSWPYLILAIKCIQRLTIKIFPYLDLCKITCWIVCSKWLGLVIRKLGVEKWNAKFRHLVLPQTSLSLSSACRCWDPWRLGVGEGVFFVYLHVAEICYSLSYVSFICFSLSMLTFGCRFFIVRFPPLKNSQPPLPAAPCLFAARTFNCYSSSYRRKETATMCTSLWYASQGQVGQRRAAFNLDPLLRNWQIMFKKYKNYSAYKLQCFRNCMLSQSSDEARKWEWKQFLLGFLLRCSLCEPLLLGFTLSQGKLECVFLSGWNHLKIVPVWYCDNKATLTEASNKLTALFCVESTGTKQSECSFCPPGCFRFSFCCFLMTMYVSQGWYK